MSASSSMWVRSVAAGSFWTVREPFRVECLTISRGQRFKVVQVRGAVVQIRIGRLEFWVGAQTILDRCK